MTGGFLGDFIGYSRRTPEMYGKFIGYSWDTMKDTYGVFKSFICGVIISIGG